MQEVDLHNAGEAGRKTADQPVTLDLGQGDTRRTAAVDTDPIEYDAFMSYSHADSGLAKALQSSLQSFAKPWYRRRALHIFRDETSLGATALWPSIERALGRSSHFILVASPTAAASDWVQREIAWWLQHRSPETIHLVLSDGELVWGNKLNDFDRARSVALPAMLFGVYHTEPLWTDFRGLKSQKQLSPRNPDFQRPLGRLASPLRNIPVEDLIGEDIRQNRRALRDAWAAGIGLALLAILLAATAIVAWTLRNESEAQRLTVESRELAVSATDRMPSDPELAVILASEGMRRAPTDQAEFG